MIVAAFAWPREAQSATIVLKSGKTLEGEILGEDGEYVRFVREDGKTVRIPRDSIEQIISDDDQPKAQPGGWKRRKKGAGWAVMLNPAGFGVGALAGGVLAQADVVPTIEASHALSLMPSFGLFKSGTVRVVNGGLGVGWRWHHGGEAPLGFFVGPLAEGSYYSLQEKDTRKRSSKMAGGAGAFLGYQWAWKSGLTLNLAAGGVYTIPNAFTVGESEFKLPPILPRFMVEVGYAFGKGAKRRSR